jgi:V8-like Glu-specific endopeptidase
MTNLVFCQEEYKTIFNEDFNSNRRKWDISNTQLSQSKITGGKLIEYNGNDGFLKCNITSVFFDKTKDYVIRFSMANLNNKNGLKYRVYTKKSNGKLKEGWIKNPQWGFVWGFKDWDNYNAFVLQKGKDASGRTKFTYRAFIIKNGNEISNEDWHIDYSYNFSTETDFYDFIIYKRNDGFTIYLDKGYDEKYLCKLTGSTNWFGSNIGLYIGAGAKVEVDYIKIEIPTPCKDAEYHISAGDNRAKGKDYKGAIEMYSEAIKMGCVSGELLYKRAEANFNREFYASAKDDCSDAISLSDDNEKAYYLRGLCKIYLDDPTAIEDLKKGGDEGIMLIKELESQAKIKTEETSISVTGSGLIISKDGYIVTNEHVISVGNNIMVEILRNGQKVNYNAKIIKVDKANDLAILKINDSKFTNFKYLPYGLRAYGVRVGEEVFSMGYPQINLQGEEIKVTDGIISSKTGFQNDVTTYQISAPIQPGNSGGPLFDKKGNLIGITNAGIPDAENVGYAIKASYLMNMLEVFNDIDLNYTNKISSLSLPDLIEKLSSYVVLIHVNSKSPTTSSQGEIKSKNIIEGGYTSTPLIDYVWDYTKKEYIETKRNEFTSKLYFTTDFLHFKRGSNDWQTVKWTYEGFNEEKNYHSFYDNYGQQIFINKDLTGIMWYYERDGKIFKKCSIYNNLTKDENIRIN